MSLCGYLAAARHEELLEGSVGKGGTEGAQGAIEETWLRR
jgi:hypothetical protein